MILWDHIKNYWNISLPMATKFGRMMNYLEGLLSIKLPNPLLTWQTIGCHSTSISKFVVYHLQPIVKNITSYVQNSNDFLNKIDTAKNIPFNCLLVTMNVEFRRNFRSQSSRKIHSHKGNHYILSSDSYIKQLHVQLQKLLTNKRLCNGASLRPKLCKTGTGKKTSGLA